jgi:hypothetical protein
MSDSKQPSNGVFASRMKADFPPGTVIFLIGMRINSFRSIRQWLPVFMAMPKMLPELFRQPDLGLLGARSWLSWRQVMVQQYWRSMDDLLAYARSAESEHLPAWKAFNQRARRNPATGIWHEAYIVEPDRSHIVYVNMPSFGMAQATSIVPARASRV